MYEVVREHFETFREQAAGLRDGEGLPDFVEQEFRDFLRCGWLGGGFAPFRCACSFERLTPFSSKGRGFCPCCCGRWMTERAAHLVDEVFLHVPVRQWVLCLPLRLRHRLAWDHDLCRAVMGRALHAILGLLLRRARDAGIPEERSRAVAIVQRFGGALNLNVHLHALVLDGVFTQGGDGPGARRARLPYLPLRQSFLSAPTVSVQSSICSFTYLYFFVISPRKCLGLLSSRE